MSLFPPLRTLTEGCACVEIFLRYPRCARRSKQRPAIYFGRSTHRQAQRSTLMSFSGIIGAPTRTSLRYRVSRNCLQVRPYLMETRRGHRHCKVSLASRITILCKCGRTFLCNSPSQPAANICIGATTAHVAPSTRRIVKGLLPTDDRRDGEGFGYGSSIRSCTLRGQFSHPKRARR
jgi:hypothetical protein